MTKVNTDDDFDFGLPALALALAPSVHSSSQLQSHSNARRICWQNPFIQFYAQAGKKVAKRKYKTFLLTINGSKLWVRGWQQGGQGRTKKNAFEMLVAAPLNSGIESDICRALQSDKARSLELAVGPMSWETERVLGK